MRLETDRKAERVAKYRGSRDYCESTPPSPPAAVKRRHRWDMGQDRLASGASPPGSQQSAKDGRNRPGPANPFALPSAIMLTFRGKPWNVQKRAGAIEASAQNKASLLGWNSSRKRKSTYEKKKVRKKRPAKSVQFRTHPHHCTSAAPVGRVEDRGEVGGVRECPTHAYRATPPGGKRDEAVLTSSRSTARGHCSVCELC